MHTFLPLIVFVFLSSSECHTLKKEDRKDLAKYLDEVTESDTDMESLCNDYFRLDHCTTLKRDNKLKPFHLANIYLQQKPRGCWEDIVEVFCELSKHDMALKVAEQHGVNKKHC
jgi:hypothetical protein